MSQYALYLSKRRFCKRCFPLYDPSFATIHNGFELENIFGIKYPDGARTALFRFALRVLRHFRARRRARSILDILRIRELRETPNYDFQSSILYNEHIGFTFYFGGWHSEKYFADIRPLLLQTFRFPKSNDEEFLTIKSLIQNDPHSVSMHIRRGDYLVKTTSHWDFSGIATLEYYQRAIAYIKSINTSPTFYIFSDDINWCKDNLKGLNAVFVTCNTGTHSWRDMQLMSLCHQHINANSTFSWWGAWLCQHSDSITICPKDFIRTMKTKDIYPETWIKL